MHEYESDVRHIITEPGQDPYREIDIRLDLRRALQKLSAYDLLLLHAAMDAQMPLKDIAQIVGVSPQRIQAQITRIIKNLKKQLAE